MITPFGLRHIWLMRELQSTSTVLDLKDALLEEPCTPLRAALRGYFLQSSWGIFTYVLRASDQVASLHGFAQARAQRAGQAWNVVRMAPALDASEDAATIWYRLLLHLCIAAGERGIQRLFACMPEDSPAEEVFRQASFTVYCHERLFWRSPAIALGGKLSTRMSPVQPENRWDVQKLNYKITPRLVLQAEELNEVQGNSRLPAVSPSVTEQGYVLYGQGGEIEGYLHIALGPRGVWLRLMAHHDASGVTAEMLDHALAVLGDYPSRPLYCAVREYQGSIQTILEERGFSPADSYSLLVKHTTVRVRERQRKLVPALEKRAGVTPTLSRSEAEGAGS